MSGAQLFIAEFDVDPIITSVATSATAAVVSPPTTSPAVPDTAFPTRAPVVPRVLTIAAFFKEVHPIKPIDERVRQLLEVKTTIQ